MRVRPLQDWLLVEYDPPKTQTEGGIIVPEGAHDDVYEWGTVVAVGPGKFYQKLGRTVPPEVKPGDRVYYVKFLKKTHTGQSIRHVLEDGTFLIQQKDIIVVGEGDRAA
jgi:co-chaperonin GroES (HSP10)